MFLLDFGIWFLTLGTSFLSADYNAISVILHVPSPSEGQEQQHKSGNIIIFTYLSPTT